MQNTPEFCIANPERLEETSQKRNKLHSNTKNSSDLLFKNNQHKDETKDISTFAHDEKDEEQTQTFPLSSTLEARGSDRDRPTKKSPLAENKVVNSSNVQSSQGKTETMSGRPRPMPLLNLPQDDPSTFSPGSGSGSGSPGRALLHRKRGVTFDGVTPPKHATDNKGIRSPQGMKKYGSFLKRTASLEFLADESQYKTCVTVLQAVAPTCVKKLIKDKKWSPEMGPQMYSVSGVVAFMDLSGYTQLTEMLAKKMRHTQFGAALTEEECEGLGAEEVMRVLNRYFSAIINIIYSHKGDVIKFAGDALLVLFPAGEMCGKSAQDKYDKSPLSQALKLDEKYNSIADRAKRRSRQLARMIPSIKQFKSQPSTAMSDISSVYTKYLKEDTKGMTKSIHGRASGFDLHKSSLSNPRKTGSKLTDNNSSVEESELHSLHEDLSPRVISPVGIAPNNAVSSTESVTVSNTAIEKNTISLPDLPQDPMDKIINNAIQASIMIVHAVQQLSTASQFPMRIKVGLAAGDMSAYMVGGEQARWEFLIAGEAVEESGKMADLSEGGNDVIIARSAWGLLGVDSEYLELATVINKAACRSLRPLRLDPTISSFSSSLQLELSDITSNLLMTAIDVVRLDEADEEFDDADTNSCKENSQKQFDGNASFALSVGGISMSGLEGQSSKRIKQSQEDVEEKAIQSENGLVKKRSSLTLLRDRLLNRRPLDYKLPMEHLPEQEVDSISASPLTDPSNSAVTDMKKPKRKQSIFRRRSDAMECNLETGLKKIDEVSRIASKDQYGTDIVAQAYMNDFKVQESEALSKRDMSPNRENPVQNKSFPLPMLQSSCSAPDLTTAIERYRTLEGNHAGDRALNKQGKRNSLLGMIQKNSKNVENEDKAQASKSFKSNEKSSKSSKSGKSDKSDKSDKSKKGATPNRSNRKSSIIDMFKRKRETSDGKDKDQGIDTLERDLHTELKEAPFTPPQEGSQIDQNETNGEMSGSRRRTRRASLCLTELLPPTGTLEPVRLWEGLNSGKIKRIKQRTEEQSATQSTPPREERHSPMAFVATASSRSRYEPPSPNVLSEEKNQEEFATSVFRFNTTRDQIDDISYNSKRSLSDTEANHRDLGYITPRRVKVVDFASMLAGFIPEPVLPLLLSLPPDSAHQWLSEIKRVTVVFMTFPALKPQKTSLQNIQQVLSIVQRAIFEFRGALRQFLVDDKGTVLIAVFGLANDLHNPPNAVDTRFVHYTAAAVGFSLRCLDELESIHVEVGIGAATGRCFCGLIGTPLRSEYTVAGDSVNLAARLMNSAQFLGKLMYCNVMVCDAPTKKASEHITTFDLQTTLSVKGKNGKVEIHTPQRDPITNRYFPDQSISESNTQGLQASPYTQITPRQTLLLHDAVNGENLSLLKFLTVLLRFQDSFPQKLLTSSYSAAAVQRIKMQEFISSLCESGIISCSRTQQDEDTDKPHGSKVLGQDPEIDSPPSFNINRSDTLDSGSDNLNEQESNDSEWVQYKWIQDDLNVSSSQMHQQMQMVYDQMLLETRQDMHRGIAEMYQNFLFLHPDELKVRLDCDFRDANAPTEFNQDSESLTRVIEISEHDQDCETDVIQDGSCQVSARAVHPGQGGQSNLESKNAEERLEVDKVFLWSRGSQMVGQDLSDALNWLANPRVGSIEPWISIVPSTLVKCFEQVRPQKEITIDDMRSIVSILFDEFDVLFKSLEDLGLHWSAVQDENTIEIAVRYLSLAGRYAVRNNLSHAIDLSNKTWALTKPIMAKMTNESESEGKTECSYVISGKLFIEEMLLNRGIFGTEGDSNYSFDYDRYIRERDLQEKSTHLRSLPIQSIALAVLQSAILNLEIASRRLILLQAQLQLQIQEKTRQKTEVQLEDSPLPLPIARDASNPDADSQAQFQSTSQKRAGLRARAMRRFSIKVDVDRSDSADETDIDHGHGDSPKNSRRKISPKEGTDTQNRKQSPLFGPISSAKQNRSLKLRRASTVHRFASLSAAKGISEKIVLGASIEVENVVTGLSTVVHHLHKTLLALGLPIPLATCFPPIEQIAKKQFVHVCLHTHAIHRESKPQTMQSSKVQDKIANALLQHGHATNTWQAQSEGDKSFDGLVYLTTNGSLLCKHELQPVVSGIVASSDSPKIRSRKSVVARESVSCIMQTHTVEFRRKKRQGLRRSRGRGSIVQAINSPKPVSVRSNPELHTVISTADHILFEVLVRTLCRLSDAMTDANQLDKQLASLLRCGCPYCCALEEEKEKERELEKSNHTTKRPLNTDEIPELSLPPRATESSSKSNSKNKTDLKKSIATDSTLDSRKIKKSKIGSLLSRKLHHSQHKGQHERESESRRQSQVNSAQPDDPLCSCLIS